MDCRIRSLPGHSLGIRISAHRPLQHPHHYRGAVFARREERGAGAVRLSVRGFDLFLSVCSIAWVGSNGADEESLGRLRLLFARLP